MPILLFFIFNYSPGISDILKAKNSDVNILNSSIFCFENEERVANQSVHNLAKQKVYNYMRVLSHFSEILKSKFSGTLKT